MSCCAGCRIGHGCGAGMAPAFVDPLVHLEEQYFDRYNRHALGDMTMSGALPTVVWPGDVDAYKRRVDPMMQATNIAVRDCPALTPSEREAWGKDYAAWEVVRQTPEPWHMLGLANKYDEVKAYEARLRGWQEALRAKCTIPGPPPPGPDTSTEETVSGVKWVAAAAIVVAVVYGVSKVTTIFK